MRRFVPIGKRIKSEKKVERPHAVIARAAGWFVDKIMRTAANGFPDRFYARCHAGDRCEHCGRGRVVLIEWKKKGEEATAQQLKRHRELRAAGLEVYVVDSKMTANKILGIVPKKASARASWNQSKTER